MQKDGFQKKGLVVNVKRQFFLFALLTSSILQGLEESPWLGDVYAFNLHSDVTYSKYRYIDNATLQPAYAYNNYLNDVSVSCTPAASLGVELGLEMARTPNQLYGFRSVFLASRYNVLDDIQGDPVSVIFGLILRGVGGRSTRDVSSPYASYMNYEALCSIGKEFSKKENWTSRGFVMGSVGIANHGSFWNRVYASLEGKCLESQVIKMFASGYFGYGKSKIVDTSHFRGWGSVRHSSLDLGVEYRYILSLWGELGVSYAYRVLAKSYPQNVQTVELSYFLPFSLF